VSEGLIYMVALIEELSTSQREQFTEILERATRLTPQQLHQYKSVAKEVAQLRSNMDDTLKIRRAATVCAKVCQLSDVVPEAKQAREQNNTVSVHFLKSRDKGAVGNIYHFKNVTPITGDFT
jgi:tRNA A37 N6-isopentenylltransferase MiaA